MGLPPSLAGVVKLTFARAFPAVAAAPIGALGTVTAGLGVTLFDAAEAGPVPTELVAVTLKV